MIELIVVMAIIAILVLLAAPRFLGRTEDAVANRIKNDIRVAETKLDEYLIRHENLDNWESAVSFSDLEDHQSNGALYDREGLMDGEDSINEGNYSVVPSDFVEREVTSQLDGDFYANDEGHVYYSPILGDGHGADDEDLTGSFEIPDYYVQATDDDFVWMDLSWEEEGTGTWHYIGEEDYVIVPDTIHGETLTSTRDMFGYGEWGENNEEWNVSTVRGVAGDLPELTSMLGMFRSNQADSLELDYFYAPNVEDMYGVFRQTLAESVSLGGVFTTSSATHMGDMFSSSQFKSLDLSNFDTSKVENMSSMFAGTQLTSLDVSPFDTSSVTDMSFMFSGLKTTELDVSGFDTSNVTNMRQMFASVRNLIELDLGSFDLSSLEAANSMFRNSDIDTINFSGFSVPDETVDIGRMFELTKNEVIDISTLDLTNVRDNLFGALFANSEATTVYVQSQEIADRLNAGNLKPSGLTFIAR